MSIINQLTTQLTALANQIPVELFVFIGSLIEEILAPIPSPLVMTLAGTIAEAQQRPIIFLLYLSFVGAIAKTISSYVLYVLADKLEDVVIGKFGKFFGISHTAIEKFGQHFNGNFRDELIIFFSRAIPIIPTAPVSIVSGAIKLPLKSYLTAGFLGILLRNFLYLYLGYASLASYETLIEKMDSIESIVTVTLAFAVVGGFAVVWYSKNKGRLVNTLQQKTLSKHHEKKNH